MLALLLALTMAAPPSNDVGEVSFANSGAPAAQHDFLRGLALLHNFEYASAAASFKQAQTIDPAFAMAYWGEAMTYTHPIWFQQDAEAARAVLKRMPDTKSLTQRERDYIAAIHVLYGDGTKEERDFKYSDAMAALHAKVPDDVDATAFYALSLLGTAHHGRDFATYMRAAALLEEVFPTHLHHPGVLHYLIHCYDDPIHAPLGMRAARLYGAVAPEAPHALHMTSHIFVALGLWDDVIDANRRAIAASKPPPHCGHYPLWLHYGLLQEHRFDEAQKQLDACRADIAKQFDQYALMRAQQVAGGGKLSDADRVAIPAGASATAKFTMAYTDLLAARDAEAIHAAATRLRELQKDAAAAVAKKLNPADRMRIDVIVQQADALERIAAGKRDEAIAILQKASEAEEAMPLEFGPPMVEKPSLELLGEQLLAAGRAADAAKAFQAQLARTPGRTATVEALQRR